MNADVCEAGCPCKTDRQDSSLFGRSTPDIFFSLHKLLLSTSSTAAEFSHFVVLDGSQGCARSLAGSPENPTTEDDRAIAEGIREMARSLAAKQKLTALSLVREALNGEHADPDMLHAWAKRFVRNEGQPISEHPSRFEQCLTIAAARDHGSPPPLSALDADIDSDFDTKLYVINDYLGDCETLADTWQAAMAHLDTPLQAKGAKAPLNESTAPYIFAEYMLFWKQVAEDSANRESRLGEFLRRMRESPPGMAVLPLRILGQYRAASVWYFCGTISPALKNLIRVNFTATSAPLITSALERAYVNGASIAILRSLHEFPALADLPLVACDRFRRSISDIVFANEIQFLGEDGRLVSKLSSSPGPNSLPSKQICLEIDLTKNVDLHEILGFQKIQFACPLFGDAKHESDAEDALSRTFDPIIEIFENSTHTLQKAVERKTRENTLVSLAATSHNFANSMRELLALSDQDSEGNASGADGSRIRLINQLAHQLTGSAWVMRILARGTSSNLLDALPEPDRGPEIEDFEFWREYMLAAICNCVFTELWREGDIDPAAALRVKFSFRVSKGNHPDFAKDSAELSSSEEVDISAGFEPMLPPSPRARERPVWPQNRKIRLTAQQLGELGQMSLLLMGPVELMRNGARYCSERARVFNTSETLEVSAEWAFDGSWFLIFSVKNPLADRFDLAPDCSEIESLKRIKRAIPSCEFKNEANESGWAHYQFKIEIPRSGPRPPKGDR